MFINGIVTSGTKVEVMNAGYGLLPNSQGYIIGIASPPGSCVVQQSIIVTRRGKGGQPRLDLKRLYTPIFYIDPDAKHAEEYYASIGKIGTHYVKLVELPSPVNLLTIDTLDFVAWATAKFTNLCGIQKNHMDIRGKFMNDGTNTPLGQIKRVLSNFTARYPALSEQYSVMDNRIPIIDEIYRYQALLSRCIKRAEASKDVMRRQAAHKILRVRKASKGKYSTIKELSKLEKSFGAEKYV